MSEKTNQKPVKCGCGGEAHVSDYKTVSGETAFYVSCRVCDTSTRSFLTKDKAITAWNKAMSGSAEEKLKAFWDGMSAEMKEKRTAKVMNDGINYCENCEGYVEAPMAYCPYCGARLEWK